MTANKSSKAVARAGDGKAARDIPDRSVTSGTETDRKGQSGWGRGGFFHSSLFIHVLPVWNLRSVCTVFAVVCYS